MKERKEGRKVGRVWDSSKGKITEERMGRGREGLMKEQREGRKVGTVGLMKGHKEGVKVWKLWIHE
jgi:hypothetical protein